MIFLPTSYLGCDTLDLRIHFQMFLTAFFRLLLFYLFIILSPFLLRLAHVVLTYLLAIIHVYSDPLSMFTLISHPLGL